GFMGPTDEVRLVRGRLRYQSEHCGSPKMFSPTEEEWQQFWVAAQLCNLWNWASRYDDTDICDGTQWEVVITLGERNLRSYGSNAYPGGKGTGYSEPFTLLLRAVRKLVGGESSAEASGITQKSVI
ncbi:MAG: hypothetical protein P0119_13275, partial [Nitrospira sp.]|nr:hypothetical protein [Nitrospira sp.]